MYNLEELLADKKKFFYVSKEVFKVVDTTIQVSSQKMKCGL